MRLPTIEIHEDTHSNNSKAQITLGTNICGNNAAAQVATNRNACSGDSGAQATKLFQHSNTCSNNSDVQTKIDAIPVVKLQGIDDSGGGQREIEDITMGAGKNRGEQQ